jgi:ABC-2 type transport system ATP-binding protein
VIAAQNLTRRFGSRTVVDGISFEVAAGEVLVLLGPNGAGKTTTLRMLAGLIAPTAGSITLAGLPLTANTGTGLRARIGFLTESPGLWDRLTVRENLTVYAGVYDIENAGPVVDRLLDTFGLLPHASARAAELSKGMRQKVAICRALLHDPDILLLDEPTSGLDPEVSKLVRDLLRDYRARGCAILLSTHNLDEAERQADRIAVLQQQLVALDTPAALRQRLGTGRLIVRVEGEASAWTAWVRAIDPSVQVDGSFLTLTLGDVASHTPRVVAALATAGAPIVEVRPELPALEDVYLHLMQRRA